MNALIKSYYFRRTNRGGGKSLTKNRVEAIGRWLQRRLFWLTGEGENLIAEFEDADYNENGEVDQELDDDELDEDYELNDEAFNYEEQGHVSARIDNGFNNVCFGPTERLSI